MTSLPPRTPGLVVPAAVFAIAGGVLGGTSGIPWWWWPLLLACAGPWLLPVALGRGGNRAVLVAVTVWMAGHGARAVQVRGTDDLVQRIGTTGARPVVTRLRVDGVGDHGMSATALGWWTPSGRLVNASGVVWVVVGTDVWVPPVGSVIDVTARGRVGHGVGGPRAILEVMRDADIEVHEGPSDGGTLGEIRAGAESVVLGRPVPGGAVGRLVAAVVLGRRERGFEALARPFRATGTAHLLAVSGLHLAVLCGVVLIPARWIGLSPRVRAPLIAGVAVLMPVVALPRIPLLRASSMAVLLALTIAGRRRVPAGSMLAVAALLVLVADPIAPLRAGFQLSFGVVAGLVWVLPAWSRRTAVAGLARPWWRAAIGGTVVAWLVSTPIVLHHFGLCSPLGIPATVFLVPLLGVVLATGYARLVFAWIPGVEWIPGVDEVLGLLLGWSAAGLLGFVEFLAAIPGTAWHGARPGWWWVLFVEAAVICVLVAPGRSVRWWAAAVVAVLAVSVSFGDV